MRSLIIAPALVFLAAACGGAQKPAESADTSSLEGEHASPSKTASAPKDSPASEAAPSDKSASGSAPAGTEAKPSEEAPAAAHPTPAATGTIDGKPFAPKVAFVMAKMQKDGRILVTLDEAHADCASTASADPGAATLSMLVPWEDGYKVDLSALKRSTPKKASGEITFSRVGSAGKKEISPTFKPSGTVTIVKAPMAASSTGKLKIDLQSGDYMLAGDLDILVCAAPK